MKKITIVQTYEIDLDESFENLSLLELVNTLNKIYDYTGEDIISNIKSNSITAHTVLSEVDEEEIYFAGSPIIIDGDEI